MSKIGFVYILTNEYMPDVYKVGCTERSPHERAAELSAATGVPAPFKVLCYIECEDFQVVERKFHEWLSEFRISNGREFFSGGLDFAVRLCFWFRARRSFVVPRPACISEWEAISADVEFYGDDEFDLSHTHDPWKKLPQPAAVDASVVAVVAAAASAASVAAEDRTAIGSGLE